MNENKPVLIFALSPRCGSTAMAEAIAESLKTNHILEPFASGWDSWASIYDISIKPSLENIFKLCKDNSIQVIKTIEYHLCKNENVYLINNCKSIFLYRKYFIDMVLSEWMSFNYCRKTDKKYAYHIRDIRNLKDFYTLKRDAIDIEYVIKNFKHLKMLKDFYISESNISTTIAYEDYFNDNVIDNHYNLLNALELKISSNEFEIILNKEQKHNSHEIYKKLIPNYSEFIKLRNDFIL